MPASMFTTLLSELQTFLTARARRAVLVPLGMVVGLLTAIIGYTAGWGAVEGLWAGTSNVTKFLLIPIALLAFLFLSYALDGLQGAVSRLFQTSLPVLRWFTRRSHAAEWRHRHDAWEQANAFYAALDAARERGAVPAASPPVASAAGRALPRYHVVAEADIVAASVGPTAPQGLVGRMILRPLAPGEVIPVDATADLPDPTRLDGMSAVPVVCAAADVPVGLGRGDVVDVYRPRGARARGGGWWREEPVQLSHGGWLVLDAQQLVGKGPGGVAGDLIGLTLAVPPEAAGQILSLPGGAAGRARVALRLSASGPAIWDRETQRRTRRWLPLGDDWRSTVAGVSDTFPRPGDFITLCAEEPPVAGNYIPLVDHACFLEELPAGWVLATKLGDAMPTAERFQRASLKVVGSTEMVPQCTTDLAGQFLHAGDAAGRVVAGVFRTLNGKDVPDIVRDAKELDGRHAARHIDRPRPVRCCELPLGGICTRRVSYRLGDAVAGRLIGVDSGVTIGFIVTPDAGSGEQAPISIGGIGVVQTIQWTIPFVKGKVVLLVPADRDVLPAAGCLEDAVPYVTYSADLSRWIDDLRGWLGRLMMDKLIVPLDYDVHVRDALKAVVLLDLLDQKVPDSVELRRRREEVRQCRSPLAAALARVLREAEYELDEKRQAFRLSYPLERAAITPTRIGNVLHAVDSYAEELYGLDAALVLPRLLTVLDQAACERLDGAKGRLDLLQWSVLGAVVVGVVGTWIAADGGAPGLALIVATLAPPLGWLLYTAAEAAALGYAEELRSAYDRDRGKVLKLLGLKSPTETTQRDEKALWRQVERWWERGAAPERYVLDTGDGGSKDGADKKLDGGKDGATTKPEGGQ